MRLSVSVLPPGSIVLHTLVSELDGTLFEGVDDREALVFVLLLGLGVRLNQERRVVGVDGVVDGLVRLPEIPIDVSGFGSDVRGCAVGIDGSGGGGVDEEYFVRISHRAAWAVLSGESGEGLNDGKRIMVGHGFGKRAGYGWLRWV